MLNHDMAVSKNLQNTYLEAESAIVVRITPLVGINCKDFVSC